MNACKAAILLAVGLAVALPAGADDTLRPGESVADRERPELDPTGMPLGAFRLYPTLELGAAYDSNLFARDEDERDDVIRLLAPGLDLESGWSRHGLDLSVRAESGRYDKSPQEDYDDLRADGTLRLDLSRESELRFYGSWHDLHEERSSPDDVDGLEPTPLLRREAAALFARRMGRFVLDARWWHTRHDYDDVPGAGGTINNDDRDRREDELDLRIGLELSRDLDLLLRAAADDKTYDVAVDDNGLNRASRGWRAGVGIEGRLGSGHAEVFAGVARRQYGDAQLTDTSTPWFDARWVWSPSGLTTLTLAARRSIDETTFAPASGYRATRFELSLDHELLRNVLLRLSLHEQRDDYIGADRFDRRRGLSFGAEYFANRYLRIGLSLSRRARTSDLDGRRSDDFEINTATLTFTVQR